VNVVNKIIKTELRNWKELIPFQPDNFKKTDPRKLKKLVESYKKNGKLNTFAVWENKGKVYIIDGHATQEVFSIMESEGISIPDKFPCIFLDLKDKREAKKAVLVYNSHYRDVDSSSVIGWIEDLNLDEIKSEIEIPELNFLINFSEEKSDTLNEQYGEKQDVNTQKTVCCPECKTTFNI
jgi:ParB-like chromosome segregation protein Spo0J